MNTYDFNDRVAIVTGGGQGIGFTVAQRILASGGKVAVWDIDTALLDKLAENLGVGPDRLLGLNVNIADLSAVREGVTAVLEKFGKIDVLINNAAIVGPNAPTWKYPPEAFNDVVQIGLIGTFNVCHAVVPHLIAQNYGRIVNVSSVAGKEGNPNAPAYSSTKAGVLALTKSLGKELAGYDIAVNAVTPAVAKTTMAMSQDPDFLKMILSKIPRGRMLELSEAASMICWLATKENSFTTASTFDLSGGRATY
ncbi:SDR family NAD(P)-dependent oxidoreductase [Devosia algicola]|uniref:SDR family NAD(P)-dependent oxidoreductase n=1 Tax=Devosia algicola TaxID=3026418 RepID=A0ABY7YLZ1_9HYPH|nr:SDR family NAD(P)-dependent oxidoreductase [Devosia algicola]WDR02330.1 SDR family NAD(P)-dependent oxidoreductase [Devosia algicola]